MNKEELIAHFQEQKEIIEKEIAFWQAQPDAEAEKPKLRHGDFGPNKEGNNRIVLFQHGTTDKGENIGERNDYGSIGIHTNTDVIPLGNIFDLSKKWSEPFDDYKRNIDCDARTFIIEKSSWTKRDLWIGVKDNNVPTAKRGVQLFISEAEEIWHALGHAIAYLKRKQ